MKTRKFRCVVTFVIPRGATLAMCRQYVEDAVKAESGLKDPADPMFYVERDTITVFRGGAKREVEQDLVVEEGP